MLLNAILIASSALSQPTFQNNLTNSPLFVSPAQYYQIDQGVAHADVTLIKYDASIAITDLRQALEADSRQYAVVLVSPVPATSARVGVTYADQRIKTTTEISAGPLFGNLSDSGSDTHRESRIAPALSYDIAGQLSLGLTYQVVDIVQSGASEEASLQYAALQSGVVFHGQSFEIGLYHTPTISIRESNISETRPGRLALHGQLKATDALTLGGVFVRKRQKAVDEASRKDNFTAMLAGDYALDPAFSLGLSAQYESMSARYESDKSPVNVSSAAFGATVDYRLQEGRRTRAALGLRADYVRTGEQSGERTIGLQTFASKVKLTGYSVATTGSYFF